MKTFPALKNVRRKLRSTSDSQTNVCLLRLNVNLVRLNFNLMVPPDGPT